MPCLPHSAVQDIVTDYTTLRDGEAEREYLEATRFSRAMACFQPSSLFHAVFELGPVVSCRVLQGVAGCCRVLQGVAGCCRVLQGVAGCLSASLCDIQSLPIYLLSLPIYLCLPVYTCVCLCVDRNVCVRVCRHMCVYTCVE